MAKGSKHRSLPSKSPRSKDSSRAGTQARKTSRSRSGSRSAHSTPRSRSSSRGRGSSSKKKTASPVVKKFDDSAAVVKKVVPVHRIPKDGSSFKIPFSNKKGVRHPLTVSLLQPIKIDNLKVKGMKLKRRLSAHCKRFTRFYALLSVLAIIGLAIFYTGYTIDQMAKSARQSMDFIVAYVQGRG